MDKFILSVGYIADDCSEERIACGDSSMTGVMELTLVIDGGMIECMEVPEVTVPCVDIEELLSNSEIWEQVRSKLLAGFGDNLKKLSAQRLLDCWKIFQAEPVRVKAIRTVAQEDDCGEFSNDEGKYNGKFYIRYQAEDEDGEYYGERVVVVYDAES